MPDRQTPSPAPAALHAPPPAPPSERRAWALACTLAVLGLCVLVAVLSGTIGRTREVAPPPVLLVTATPTAAAVGATAPATGGARARATLVTLPSTARPSGADSQPATAVPIATSWMEGFYPIYAEAQRTFAVNWLLIASIHMQETAFSTAPSTYHGLNFAHCCGGPMQFNVSNGRVSTWDLVSNSYLYARRPPAYDHPTRTHPSIYDDFDSITAAAHLLSVAGAGYLLDGSAWGAAYAYYGHDASGVSYADVVLARAIGWSQHGFCINCGVQPEIVTAVHAAYGAPALAALESVRPRAVERLAVAARRR